MNDNVLGKFLDAEGAIASLKEETVKFTPPRHLEQIRFTVRGTAGRERRERRHFRGYGTRRKKASPQVPLAMHRGENWMA